MGFGFAGAGAGAAESLEDMLVRRRAAALQQQQLLLQQEQAQRLKAQDDFERQQTLRGNANDRAKVALQYLSPGEITDEQAAPIKASDFAPALKTVTGLSRRGMAGDLASGTMAQTQDAGGQRMTVLQPTRAQEVEAGKVQKRRVVADLFKRGAPRNELAAAFTDAGENVPASLLAEDPAAHDTREHANRLDEIHAQGEESRRTAQARPSGDDRLVPVTTTENGKTVTKYLPESSLRGQTFEKPNEARRPIGAERTALGFYNRGKQASDAITESGYEEQFAKAGVLTQAQGSLPNIMQSSDQQAYRQAQRAFTEARLRKESGAAVPPQEYENDAKTYFAVAGDSPEVIAQKRKARQAVLDGLAFQAGPAYEEYYGEPLQRNSAGVSGSAGTAPKAAGHGGRVYYDANGNPVAR